MKTIYILLITVLSWSLQACTAQCGKPDACTDSIPRIYPDYAGVTFPLNIAPPNFRIGENADAFQTEIGTGEPENKAFLLFLCYFSSVLCHKYSLFST